MLSIIIVNWNTRNLLKKCLESIYQETRGLDYEIFVVDNASQDKSAEMAKKEFLANPEFSQRITLITNNKNLGFAKASNQAIKQCQGDFILLLNPDTIILDRAIEKCLDFFITNSKIGILGCKLLNPDKSWQPSCRTFPTLSSQIIILLKLHHLFKNLKIMKKYLMLDMDPNIPQEVDQVMGAFFLIRKELIQKIGLLDEKYWIWFEEVDFCRRAMLANFKTYFWPGASIIHYKAQSFNQVFSTKKQWHYNGAMLQYFFKFHPIFSFGIILILWPLSMLLAFLVNLGQLKKLEIKSLKN